MAIAQQALNVVCIFENVIDQDIVKALGRVEKCGVCLDELHCRILAAGLLDHALREINAHAPSRLDCRQQVAGCAAELEDRHSGRDVCSEQGTLRAMEVCVAVAVELPVIGHRVEVRRQNQSLGPLPHPGRRAIPRIRAGSIAGTRFNILGHHRGLDNSGKMTVGHTDFCTEFLQVSRRSQLSNTRLSIPHHENSIPYP